MTYWSAAILTVYSLLPSSYADKLLPTFSSQRIARTEVTCFGDSLINFALQFVGTPYAPGGCSKKQGFDCSGLVHYSYTHFGISLGRSAAAQANAGKAISLAQSKPGDILTFSRGRDTRIFHSGLVVSNSADALIMLHANKRNGIHLTNLSASTYWSDKLHEARRITR